MSDLFHPELILCPTDYSDSAVKALRYADEFARCFESRLLVMYADSFQPPPYFTSGQINELAKSIKKAREKAGKYLNRWVDEHVSRSAIPKDTRIVETTPVNAILVTAEQNNAGLIVMGTHGMSGFNRFMLGSVTERVLHETNRPVLTVRGGRVLTEMSRPLISRVLCPVNYSEIARKALQHAAMIAECFRAELLALHVVEQGEEGGEEEFKRQLCSWMNPEQRNSCNLRQLVLRGNPSDHIIATAAANGCDMIVLGAQHRRFFDTTVIGTTTVHVTRHSECPVFTVVQAE